MAHEVPTAGPKPIRYRRARFSTRLYDDCLYTPAHAWLRREDGETWRIGYTQFAMRMLGEPVELEFEAQPGDAIARGQGIGWLEGFKAVSDIYAPMDGVFRGVNPALLDRIDLLGRDPHQAGWLYRVEGAPGPDCLDRAAYMAVLDTAIDTMMGDDALK